MGRRNRSMKITLQMHSAMNRFMYKTSTESTGGEYFEHGSNYLPISIPLKIIIRDDQNMNMGMQCK